MDQEKIKAVAETLSGVVNDYGGCDDKHNDKHHKKVDCCCPKFFIFLIFDDIRCVQIFNGACEDWRPGANCG